MSLSTQILSPTWTNINEQVRKIVLTVNNIARGKTNNTGSVTLTANAASTTLSDIRIGINSVITLQPTTANAATAIASTYLSSPVDSAVTINHTNNAQTDRTFKYVING